MTTTEKMTLEKFAEQAHALLKAKSANGTYTIVFSMCNGVEQPHTFKLMKQEKVK